MAKEKTERKGMYQQVGKENLIKQKEYERAEVQETFDGRITCH